MLTTFETERTFLRPLGASDIPLLSQRLNYRAQEAEDFIQYYAHHLQEFGFSVLGVFIKQSHKLSTPDETVAHYSSSQEPLTLIGVAGCHWLHELNTHEVELYWDIHKTFSDDDIDTEVLFEIRNRMMRTYTWPSLIALIDPHDLIRRNAAESVDMEEEKEVHLEGKNLLVYRVSREMKKFQLSFGDEEHAPMRTDLRRYKDEYFSPLGHLKRPRRAPYR